MSLSETPGERKDFFISYNQADRAWAEWIGWVLERAGYRCVLQAWDFRPGSNFVLDMQRAASETERTIVVLSEAYLAARFTQPEWAAAFARDPTGGLGVLVPVRVGDCDLTGLWSAIVYIDLVGIDEPAAEGALLAGVKRARPKPQSKPTFPSSAHKPRFPGALPAIWKVPYLRNLNFSGREAPLEELYRQLREVRLVAIAGLSGVGKTQLAVEYAYRHVDDYDVVWWVRAEEPAILAADYAALAEHLDLPKKDNLDQGAQIEAVRTWCGQNERWLLVFDNARDPGHVKAYLPQGKGHVVITSRNQLWRGVAQLLDLAVLDRSDSVRFLLKRSGQEEENTAGELAKELGDLPLALEQAAACCDGTGQSLADYLSLFRERHAELLAERSKAEEYPESVAGTWTISLTKLRAESAAAADLFTLCAFFAPDDIQKSMIIDGSDLLPESLQKVVANPLRLNDAFAALRNYSLITVTGDGLYVHRLVQAVTRDKLGRAAFREWAAAAAKLVSRAYPFEADDVRTWGQCARLLPHALAAIEWADSAGVGEAGTRAVNQAGVYLRQRADLASAKACFERTLRIGEMAYGPDHPKVATRVNNLGRVLQDQSKLAAAKACFERALRIDEAAYGPAHPSVATDVNNLGGVLRGLGDLAGAKACYERALRIDEAGGEPDNREVASIVTNLGSVLKDLGDLVGARACFERVQCIDEMAYGADHPEVATDVNNLGSVLRHQADLAGAKACFERALRIDEAAYGPDHPHVARDLNNLGSVLQEQGELAGAQACFERALRIAETAYGPDHPEAATNISNLGSVLRRQGDLARAQACFERALRIHEAAYGPAHSSVATDVNNLGGVLLDQGDLAGARACYERALSIFTRAFGPDHRNTKIVRDKLARLSR